MNATDAMARIEGHAFAAMVNLASDFPTFLRILTAQPEVCGLAEAMKSEQVTSDVLARVMELAAGPATEGHEHPADAALAAYLWLLSATDHANAERAVETIRQCAQCWWARKMAEHLQSQQQPETLSEALPVPKGS